MEIDFITERHSRKTFIDEIFLSLWFIWIFTRITPVLYTENVLTCVFQTVARGRWFGWSGCDRSIFQKYIINFIYCKLFNPFNMLYFQRKKIVKKYCKANSWKDSVSPLFVLDQLWEAKINKFQRFQRHSRWRKQCYKEHWFINYFYFAFINKSIFPCLVKEGCALLLYHSIIIVITHIRNTHCYIHIYALYESSSFS